MTRTSSGDFPDSNFNPSSCVAVKSEGPNGSDGVSNPGVGAAVESINRALVKCKLTSNNPFTFVLSITMRSDCPCNRFTSNDIGMAVADRVELDGPRTTLTAPRGNGSDCWCFPAEINLMNPWRGSGGV